MAAFWSTRHPNASYKVSVQLAQGCRRSRLLIYKSSQCFLPGLESIGFWVQEKKRKIDFQDGSHGRHLGFPIGMIWAIFDLQVTPMLPSKFGVNWPFGSGEEAKNRFLRWQLFDLQVTPMLITKFRFNWPRDVGGVDFWSTSHPNASYQVWSQLAFGFRRRSEK